MLEFFCCKQKTAYEMRIGDWSSDVCSSDLAAGGVGRDRGGRAVAAGCARVALAFPRRARRAAAGQRRGRGMNNTWKQRREGGGWFAIWLIRGIGRYGGRALARGRESVG